MSSYFTQSAVTSCVKATKSPCNYCTDLHILCKEALYQSPMLVCQSEHSVFLSGVKTLQVEHSFHREMSINELLKTDFHPFTCILATSSIFQVQGPTPATWRKCKILTWLKGVTVACVSIWSGGLLVTMENSMTSAPGSITWQISARTTLGNRGNINSTTVLTTAQLYNTNLLQAVMAEQSPSDLRPAPNHVTCYRNCCITYQML